MNKALLIIPFALASLASLVRAETMPRYNIENYCQQVAKVPGGSAKIFNGCMEAEQKAYKKLKPAWEQLPGISRSYCELDARHSGGSYIKLEGCMATETGWAKENSLKDTGPAKSARMSNQMDFRRIPESLLAHYCLMYELGNKLRFLEGNLRENGFSLDEFYAQYHLIDCHESRMTPIYRFIMGMTPNFLQREVWRELDYFRAMDEARRFEILNRVDVWHRRDGSERMRLTLLDQVHAQVTNLRSQNSAFADSHEAFMQTLISLGAKRHSEMTAAELQRAPVRSRK